MKLAELAGQFSPLVEKTSDDTVVFSITGLGSLFGNAHQIASAIARQGAAMGLCANLAIAVNPSAAILAARNLSGTTIIARGKEAETLNGIPVEALPAEPELILTLHRWGVRTLGELAALPEDGLAERLGEAGPLLRRLALGEGDNLLNIERPVDEFCAKQDLDDPVDNLEPLLFLIGAHLRDLMRKLIQHGCSTNRVTVALKLEGGGTYIKTVELPVAASDPAALLKQIQLAMEAQPPQDASVAVSVTLDAADPHIVQSGLFLPSAPEPEKLQTLLARLEALVGKDRVGSPEILNSHRPDAYAMRPCAFEPAEPKDPAPQLLRLSMRYFRPPVAARVMIVKSAPAKVVSSRVTSDVLEYAGPWRTSGGWWGDEAWKRDEWDVVLKDQVIYRIYVASEKWFLEGSYD